MRKDRFMEYYGNHAPYLRTVLTKRGVDYDDAGDILSECLERLVRKKVYKRIKAKALKGFLRSAIVWSRGHYDEKIEARRAMTPSITETIEKQSNTLKIQQRVAIPDEIITEVECPFCFKNNLNEYGACNMCHTILPTHKRTRRNVIVMDEISLAVRFDFAKQIDIQNAIKKLTPAEQRVVIAVGLGNETLDSFTEISEYTRPTIYRTWLTAKAKLQVLLREYNTGKVVQRGEKATRAAFQHVDLTN